MKTYDSYRYGKSLTQMVLLKSNLEKGLSCIVVTLNSTKTKRDFNYMTGAYLDLAPIDLEKDVYKATLIQKATS